MSCYCTAMRLVNKGLTSWDKLEISGKANPASEFRGKKPYVKSWFLSDNQTIEPKDATK